MLHPAARPAITHLEALIDSSATDRTGHPLVRREGNRLRLRPDCVAQLDAASASQLNLPRATALALDIKAEGSIHQDDFHLRVRWVHPGGGPVRAVATGAILQAEGGLRRIPEPIWSLYCTANRLTSPLPEAERFRCIADLQSYWPEDPRTPATADAFLRDLRIHYASAFSLKLRELQPDRTDFDPVLFGQGTIQVVRDGGTVDEELESCLAPRAQKLFAEDRFRREADVRPVYVLRDGEYIFIDPALRPVLRVVRQLQDQPEQVKREFVLNPRKVLKERLEETGCDQPDLEDLFIETEQFSERVAGVDTWRVPVLPWLQPVQKNQWFPERFGFRVGDGYYTVESQHIPVLMERAEQARRDGAQSFPAGDLLTPVDKTTPPPPSHLPFNDQVRESIATLAPFARLGSEEKAVGEAEKTEILTRLRERVFLVVRENFEEVDYSSLDAGTDPGDADNREQPPVPLPSVDLPKRLKTPLKPHQRDGLAWLVRNLLVRRTGALLADDMGLGKTLQAIAFMAWLQEQAAARKQPLEPILIVAPTSLLGSWQSEIHKHLHEPRLGKIVLAFGSALKLLREEAGLSARDIEVGRATLASGEWKDAGVVLTTYETMRDYHFSFARHRFSLIVFDEMQKLKNPVSQLTRAAKALNAGFILGMTGTPVENRLQDLWSIMDILAPGLLGSSREFERRYPASDASRLQELKARLLDPRGSSPSWLLRRLKSDALDALPAKHVHIFKDPMPPLQAREYEALVLRALAQCQSGSLRKGRMLELLGAMRSISLYPEELPDSSDLRTFASHSARLSRMLMILEDIRARNEKALLFIESLTLQARMAELLKDHFNLPHTPMRINGSVPAAHRQEIVERFQARPGVFDVLILSPKAGGVGLNLMAANHVIHLSRWWNPAVEDQATDRVYRIGQEKDVHIYLPMAVHPSPQIGESSFDLRLHALLERKRKLTQALLAPAEPEDNDIATLFGEVALHPDTSDHAPTTVVTPRDIGEPAGSNAPAEGLRTTVSSSGPEASPGQASGEMPDVAGQSLESASSAPVSPRGDRKVLTLAKQLNRPEPRRFEWKPRQARQLDSLFSLFRHKTIEKLVIRDPYALADRAQRRAHVRFLQDLAAAAQRIDHVVIEYAPDYARDANDAEMRRDFGRAMTEVFGTRIFSYQLQRRFKRVRHDDFHDRTIEIYVRRTGGAINRHLLDGGRGVLALYDDT